MFEFISSEYSKGPGVYLMKDAKGRIIYVGKAKSLVKRLASYFRGQDRHTPKTKIMVSRIRSIETLSTASEKEALLLEASLIKKHRPRYNIVLRDDKSYVLFRLTKRHDYPRLVMTRKVVRDGSVYYGPFTSAYAAKRTWKILGKAFQLRKCGDRMFLNRVRPCLYHHIGQCLAPCVKEVPKEEYAALVRRVEMVLAGRSGEVVSLLKKEMLAASEALEFERAALFRDRIQAVEATVEKQAAVLLENVDLDCVAIAETSGGLGLGLLFVRQGRLLDAKSFHWAGLGLEEASEVVAGFLTQFYWQTRFIPGKILLPWELEDSLAVEEALGERRSAPVKLITPSSGPEKRLLEMARTNAAQARATGEDLSLSVRLGKVLRQSDEIRRIECVDISHLGGKGMRGGMVVFDDGEPDKSSYRTYSFPELEGTGDDYAAMADFIERRVKKGPPWPDLLLVDGGRGQVSAVMSTLEKVGGDGNFAVAGIAKATGEPGQGPDRRAGALDDRIFLPGRKNHLPIRPGSPELLYLQRVRDEAHRFVIGRQRKTRSKVMVSSQLESLEGVGPKTARLLWDAFGSLDAMREASLKDLKAVQGLGTKRAEKIYAALKELTGK